MVLADHKALEDGITEKGTPLSAPAGWRASWHEKPSKFDCRIQYVTDNNNVVADAVSRLVTQKAKHSRTAVGIAVLEAWKNSKKKPWKRNWEMGKRLLSWHVVL